MLRRASAALLFFVVLWSPACGSRTSSAGSTVSEEALSAPSKGAPLPSTDKEGWVRRARESLDLAPRAFSFKVRYPGLFLGMTQTGRYVRGGEGLHRCEYTVPVRGNMGNTTIVEVFDGSDEWQEQTMMGRTVVQRRSASNRGRSYDPEAAGMMGMIRELVENVTDMRDLEVVEEGADEVKLHSENGGSAYDAAGLTTASEATIVLDRRTGFPRYITWVSGTASIGEYWFGPLEVPSAEELATAFEYTPPPGATIDD